MNTITVHPQVSTLPVQSKPFEIEAGKSLAEIAGIFGDDPVGMEVYLPGKIVLWEPVPAAMLPFVRPKAGMHVKVAFRPGRGGAGRLFQTVAAVALAVAAPYLAAGLGTLVGAGAAFAVGTFGNAALSAAIQIGGAIALQKVFPTGGAPRARRQREQDDGSGISNVTTDSNPYAKRDYLTVVANRRIAPKEVSEPYIYQLDGVDAVERLFALHGKHLIESVQVDTTPIDTFPAITTEIIDGDESDTTYSFFDRSVANIDIGENLSTFALETVYLEDQDEPSNSEPRWVYFTTPGHERLAEVVIRMRLSSFLKSDDEDQPVMIPIRLQARPKGGDDTDWVSYPEMHIKGRDIRALVFEHRTRWDNDFGSDNTTGSISCDFWREVPAAGVTLSDGNAGVQWTAASVFSSGTGLKDVQNISWFKNGFRARLSENDLPKGPIEWRIMRGVSLKDDTLDPAGNYQVDADNTIKSLFVGWDSSGRWRTILDQGAYLASADVIQAIAIADEYPVQLPATAQLAIRSRGQSVKNVTCYASRYVLDWDGSAWVTSTATSKNPATHFYNFLLAYFEEYGIDTALIDNDGIVAWRAECASRGYECSYEFGGEAIGDILFALAVAGFARMRISAAGFGVDYFRDRSAETPVQSFSPRNTGSIESTIVLPERQAGIRALFQNEDDEWREDEIEIVLDNAADVRGYDPVSYTTISNPDLVRKRAYFDLLQATERRREWKIEASIEATICEIGDLITVVTDLFDDNALGARIRGVPDASTLVLDQLIPAVDSVAFSDNPPVSDAFDEIGESSLIFVTTPTGMEMRTITGRDGNVVTLNSALSSTDLIGAHVTITNESNSRHRCIVTGVERTSEERAVITAVDEAPQIWDKMVERFG